MRFAAGITISGIISLIILELLQGIMPSIKAWVLGVLVVALKVVLVLFTIMVAVAVIGIGIYFYKRGERAHAEA